MRKRVGRNASVLPTFFGRCQIGNVGADDGRFAERLDNKDIQVGRDKPALARSIRRVSAGPANLAGTAKDNEKFEARFVRGAIAETSVLSAFRCEVTACGEKRPCATLCRQRKARNLFHDSAGEVRYRERFFEMEFTRFARGTDAAVIVNPIGEI